MNLIANKQATQLIQDFCARAEQESEVMKVLYCKLFLLKLKFYSLKNRYWGRAVRKIPLQHINLVSYITYSMKLKQFIHKICQELIPLKCLTWRQTKFLMGINYWANKEEFVRLVEESKESNLEMRRE